MKRATWIAVVAVAALGGCSKKESAPPATASPEATKYLPAGAALYAEVDVKGLLGAEVLSSVKDKILEQVPAPCRGLANTATKAMVAAYGSPEEALGMFGGRKVERLDDDGEPVEDEEPPKDIVVVLMGPSKADMVGCVEGIARENDVEIRTETREGVEVRIREGGEGGWRALFSPDDTVHVLTTLARLDAALAAAGGGASLTDAELLGAMGSVPSGTLVAVAALPPSLGDMMGEALKMFSGGKSVPAPKLVALSVAAGGSLDITAALTMGDETSADALFQVANGALGFLRTMLGAAGGDDPDMAKVKPLLDSLQVTRSGAVVSVKATVPGSIIQEALSKAGRDAARAREM